jgi:glycerophosphoryl diester phosphodiesterase
MNPPLNIAHRGARSLAPENTVAAAREALHAGADMWELDVGVTLDGELVVIHDESLTRTTNAESLFPGRAPWLLQDFTLTEIKKLDTGNVFIARDPFEQIAAGVIPVEKLDSYRGELVPTLHEALLFTRDHSWRVNIELKLLFPPLQNFPLVQRVTGLIREMAMEEQVLISSFVPLYLKQVRALSPDIDISLLTKGPVPLSEQLYLEQKGINLTPLHSYDGIEPRNFLASLKCRIYHPHYSLLDLAQIKLMQSDGFTVNAWTVNDRVHIMRLIEAGIDGIITDYPQTLRHLLDSM